MRVYELLVAYRKVYRARGYTERHHIVPRSRGGSDDASNVVTLTGREHYLAHWLLAKIHGGTMWVALMRMGGNQRRRIHSRLYEAARRNWSREMSESQRGEKNHFYGKSLSPEHVRKVSEAMKARRLTALHKARISAAHLGRVVSEETRAKQSAARRGRFVGSANPMFGKKRPDLAQRNRERARATK